MIRIGVSSCLLGNRVRYDGTHRHDPFITGTLGRLFELVPLCPEAEVGMGTPRETVQLVMPLEHPRMLGTRSRRDWTDAMRDFSERRVEQLAAMGLRGCILKSRSPSCGMERVAVHDEAGLPMGSSRGLFADALMRRLPMLPVEEEGRLHDPGLRDSFIERVFAYDELMLRNHA